MYQAVTGVVMSPDIWGRLALSPSNDISGVILAIAHASHVLIAIPIGLSHCVYDVETGLLS